MSLSQLTFLEPQDLQVRGNTSVTQLLLPKSIQHFLRYTESALLSQKTSNRATYALYMDALMVNLSPAKTVVSHTHQHRGPLMYSIKTKISYITQSMLVSQGTILSLASFKGLLGFSPNLWLLGMLVDKCLFLIGEPVSALWTLSLAMTQTHCDRHGSSFLPQSS